ncbi:MAG TPA: hypothetical protein VIJ70_02515 [Gaiellaceae bacterium]
MVINSYAMTWWVGDGPRQAGKIELDPSGVALTATTGCARAERIDFDQIVGVVLDRRTLRVRRANAPELRIGSLDTPGTLRELADRVTAATVAAGNH